MTLPTDPTRCGKDRIAIGHFHYCQLERGHEGQHECLCGALFWTLLEEAKARGPGKEPPRDQPGGSREIFDHLARLAREADVKGKGGTPSPEKQPIQPGPRDIPPFRMKWGHLCVDAIFGEYQGNEHASVGQLLTGVGCPPGSKTFQGGHFAGKFDAAAGADQNQTLEVRLVRYPQGDILMSQTGPLPFHSIGEGYRLVSQMKFPLTNWPAQPIGDYAFQFRIHDELLGELAFGVNKPLPPPDREDGPPLRVNWIHLCSERPEMKSGTIHGIIDFVRLPKGKSAIDMDGKAIFFQSVGALPPDGGTVNRRLRVRFLNGQGKDVRPEKRFNVAMTMWSENRLARRSIQGFDHLMLPQDDYTFELYMDDIWVKTLDFSVLPSQ